MPDSLPSAIRDSGLVAEGESAVVLASGGADSACAAAGLSELLGAARVRAVHVNYGLRDDSDEDERACALLCERLGIELEVERPELGGGNVQAAARAARYAAAEALRKRARFDWVATGHNRTDLAETVIYRLASSPGRRALLGLAPRHGRVIRPLLGLSRDRLRELAREEDLPFRDDPSNRQPLYARNRIRAEVLPVLRELSAAAEATIAATWAELAEESELLDELAEQALEGAGAGSGAVAISAPELEALHPALRRLALRRLAERLAGAPVVLGPERCAEIVRLAGTPEGGVIELGGGVEASVEHGHVRFRLGGAEPSAKTSLRVPGSCKLGGWELRAELLAGSPGPEVAPGPEAAVLDAVKLGPLLTVRTWREGDRMRPLGLGGSKSLQDLFTDAKVPRSLRRELPIVTSSDDRIAWVAGVAVSEEFRLGEGTERSALLTARAA